MTANTILAKAKNTMKYKVLVKHSIKYSSYENGEFLEDGKVVIGKTFTSLTEIDSEAVAFAVLRLMKKRNPNGHEHFSYISKLPNDKYRVVLLLHFPKE